MKRSKAIEDACLGDSLSPGHIIGYIGEDNKPQVNYVFFATLVKKKSYFLEERKTNPLAHPFLFLLILEDHWRLIFSQNGKLNSFYRCNYFKILLI